MGLGGVRTSDRQHRKIPSRHFLVLALAGKLTGCFPGRKSPALFSDNTGKFLCDILRCLNYGFTLQPGLNPQPRLHPHHPLFT
jgi:hypothetical protein